MTKTQAITKVMNEYSMTEARATYYVEEVLGYN